MVIRTLSHSRLLGRPNLDCLPPKDSCLQSARIREKSSTLEFRIVDRPQPTTEGENRMAGFTYRLELEDGTLADPPSLETAVPDLARWRHNPVGAREDFACHRHTARAGAGRTACACRPRVGRLSTPPSGMGTSSLEAVARVRSASSVATGGT
jgi:hypothetical protein